VTISLYRGFLTWNDNQNDIFPLVPKGAANVVENDEGPVDTADSVVADPRRHPVR
jgi:hypothetical protein